MAQVLDQIGKGTSRRARAGDEDHRDVDGHVRTDLPVRFAKPASGSIAGDRTTDLPAHRESHSPLGRALPERDEARPFVSTTVLEDRLELRRSPEALASRQRQRRLREHRAGLDRQALASLCPTPLEHVAPALRLHPRAKAVRLLPTPHIGLKRPLHENFPSRSKNLHSLRSAPRQVKERKGLATVGDAVIRSPPASEIARAASHRRARWPARCKNAQRSSVAEE